MPNATNLLRFGWNFDTSFGLDAVSYSLKLVEVICTMPVHVWVITTVNVKGYVISKDIRNSYIFDQTTMLLYGLMIGFLLEPYPVYPWPGYYCDGLLCRFLGERTLSILFGSTIASVIPFFCYILIRLHNQVVSGTATLFIISPRNQIYVMVAICSLAAGMIGFYAYFVVSVDSGAMLSKAPELSALLSRGGKVIILGTPGHAGDFVYVVAYMFLAGGAIFSLLTVLTVHSMVVIKQREKMFHLSEKTQRAQDRLAIAFCLQLIAAALFYVVPMLSMVLLMLVDTSCRPPALLSTIRPLLIVALSLKPPVQSLIYLSKNPVLRKRSLYQMINWLPGVSLTIREDSTPVKKVSQKNSIQSNTAF